MRSTVSGGPGLAYGSPHSAWRLALLGALFLLRAAALASEPNIELPPQESASDWTEPLQRVGLKAGAGGVQVAVQHGEWWLRVDTPTGQRSAVVKAPRDRADREAVAALAAALLSPGPGVARGGSATSAALTLPPPARIPVNPNTAPARKPEPPRPDRPATPAPPRSSSGTPSTATPAPAQPTPAAAAPPAPTAPTAPPAVTAAPAPPLPAASAPTSPTPPLPAASAPTAPAPPLPAASAPVAPAPPLPAASAPTAPPALPLPAASAPPALPPTAGLPEITPAANPATPTAAREASAPAPAPAATPAPAPTSTPVATASTAPTAPTAPSPALRIAGLAGPTARVRGDFAPAFGVAADLRVQAGVPWVQVGGSLDAPTAVAGTATATVVRFGGLAGAGFSLWSAGELSVGAGAQAQRWGIEDVDGTHAAWGAELRAQVAAQQRIAPGLAVQIGVAPAIDLQKIRIVGESLDPSPITFEFFLKIRAGR